MNRTASPDKLVRELSKSFVEGVNWPIDLAALTALLDIGLNPQQIARYFRVTPDEVVCLMKSSGGIRPEPGVE